MLGNAKELEKNMVYATPEWDSPMMRIRGIKKGRDGVVITHHDSRRRYLDNHTAVRFFEAGKEPK